jgi:hypothetical protein
MHHVDFSRLGCCQLPVGFHILERAENQGQGGAQLMGDIGEEPQFLSVEFALVDALFPFIAVR